MTEAVPAGSETDEEDGICPKCLGSGQVDGEPCPRCDGTGKLVEGIGGG